MATRKIGPGPGRRLHLHPQAGERDAADRAGDGGDPGRGRRARRRRQRAAVAALRRGRLGDAARPAGAQAVLHRLHRGRPGAAGGGRRRRSSTARWSSAATRRSWSSPTPTSTRRSTARWSRRCATPARPARRPTGSTSRRAVAEEFSRRLAERMAALRVGPGTDERHQVGPLVNADAVAKVRRAGRRARSRTGAHALTGGSRPTGRGLVLPADRADRTCRPDAAILREEIFGPVAPIVDVHRRGRGGPAGQRHRVRARRLRLHRRPRPRAAGQRGAGGRHGRR